MKKLDFTFFLYGMVSVLFACRPTTTQESGPPKKQLLEGTWHLPQEELYHRLYFQDSMHVGLDTHIDTIFFYTYALRGDTLCLYDDYGQLVNHNIILKLDHDSLIFNNLLDKVGVQRYSRQKPSPDSL